MNCLSLFGFLPDSDALQYLAGNLDSVDQKSCLAEARARLASVAIPPTLQAPEPVSDAQSLQDQLSQRPAMGLAVPEGVPWGIGRVEIDRLCIYQMEIGLARVERILGWLPENLGEEAVRETCLPLCPHVDVQMKLEERRPDGLISAVSFVSDDPNLRLSVTGEGRFNDMAQVFFCVSNGAPYVMVGQWHDRVILMNGYHRLYALRERGITSVPCLVRSLSSYSDTGGTQPGCLPEQIVLSPNPPRFGHFTRERARIEAELGQSQHPTEAAS